ncbi:uncharacterized protein LOC117146962 [Drosophila mauritiana]|uniref:Uncharacterized protein LOC117146962 n=1 Tax=Drosophila mauritiana TaxID=7226 RepID=A0A6P8L2A5_DROMA|nr:uncharacterized protein LOC117146962 [Drosophila mauritiana]
MSIPSNTMLQLGKGKGKARARDSHTPNVAVYTNARTLRSVYSMVSQAAGRRAAATAAAAASSIPTAQVNDHGKPSRVWNSNKPKKMACKTYNVYSKKADKLSGEDQSKLGIRQWLHPPYPVHRERRKRVGSRNYESFYVPYEQEDAIVVKGNPSTETKEQAAQPRSRSFQRLPTAGERYALNITKMASLIEKVKSHPDDDGVAKAAKKWPLLPPPPQFAEDPIDSGQRFALLRSQTVLCFSTLGCDELLYKYACHLPFVRNPLQPDVVRPKMKRLPCERRVAERSSIEGNSCTIPN